MTTPVDIDFALLSTEDKPPIRRIFAARGLAYLTGRTYPSEVLADNPLFYWRFGEASGWVAADSSPNNFNATYGDGSDPTTTPTLAAGGLLVGDTDTAVTFAGPPESVTSNDVLSALGTNMPNSTWEFWIKSTDTTHSGQLFSFGGGGSNFEIDYDGTTDRLDVFVFDTEVGGDAVAGDVEGHATTNLNDGNAHHVVIRVDSTTTFSVWVDEVSKTVTYTSQVQLDAPTAPDQIVGIQPAVTSTLDEFAVYDHRLSDARIAAHYAAGTTRPVPDVDALSTNQATAEAMQTEINSAKSLIDSLVQSFA